MEKIKTPVLRCYDWSIQVKRRQVMLHQPINSQFETMALLYKTKNATSHNAFPVDQLFNLLRLQLVQPWQHRYSADVFFVLLCVTSKAHATICTKVDASLT